jgi:hypothetical protein
MDEANESMSRRGSQLCELLRAYHGVLDAADNLSPFVLVRWTQANPRRLKRLCYLPRPRSLLRYFVIRHVDRTLAALDRRYSMRASLGTADLEQRDREAAREFRYSLPSTRPKTYLILLVLAIIVLGRHIVEAITSYAVGVTALDDKHNLLGNPQLRQHVQAIVDELGASVDPSLKSVNGAVDALLNGGFEEMILVIVGLALALYAVLRPFVPAFRLKRMFFNLASEAHTNHRSVTARWAVSQSRGVFELEHLVFEKLGSHPPPEFPFDLTVSALIMLLPLWWGSLFIRLSFVDAVEFRTADIGVGGLVVVLALLRLGWLYRTWRRRQSRSQDMCMPFEVRIPRGLGVAKVESPLSVASRPTVVALLLFFSGFGPGLALWEVIGYPLLLSLPVTVPWWYRINRELRDLGRAYDNKRLGHFPILSLLAMTVGWLALLPPFISVFRTCRRIRRAQAMAYQPDTLWSPWLRIPALLLYPILFAYLQHELNKVWVVEGEPVDGSPRPQPLVHKVVEERQHDRLARASRTRDSRGRTTSPEVPA